MICLCLLHYVLKEVGGIMKKVLVVFLKILDHAANYWHQLNGCIALGRRPADINNDGYMDVTSSKSTMKDFHKALKGYTKAILIIIGKQDVR